MGGFLTSFGDIDDEDEGWDIYRGLKMAEAMVIGGGGRLKVNRSGVEFRGNHGNL